MAQVSCWLAISGRGIHADSAATCHPLSCSRCRLHCNGSVFFFIISSAIRLHLILSYVVSYLHILSYSSLDLCIMLCVLPPLTSYSLAPSSVMMSCTVHSSTDSLVQPSCILVYIVCNPAPRGSPFELSLGLCSSQSSPIPPLPSEPCVWCFVLGSYLGSPQRCRDQHL